MVNDFKPGDILFDDFEPETFLVIKARQPFENDQLLYELEIIVMNEGIVDTMHILKSQSMYKVYRDGVRIDI